MTFCFVLGLVSSQSLTSNLKTALWNRRFLLETIILGSILILTFGRVIHHDFYILPADRIPIVISRNLDVRQLQVDRFWAQQRAWPMLPPKGRDLFSCNYTQVTLLKTEKWWLEDKLTSFLLGGKGPGLFSGDMLVFRECKHLLETEMIHGVFNHLFSCLP